MMHPGPRARVASKPIPATQTILYWGLGFCFLISSALFLFLGGSSSSVAGLSLHMVLFETLVP